MLASMISPVRGPRVRSWRRQRRRDGPRDGGSGGRPQPRSRTMRILSSIARIAPSKPACAKASFQFSTALDRAAPSHRHRRVDVVGRRPHWRHQHARPHAPAAPPRLPPRRPAAPAAPAGRRRRGLRCGASGSARVASGAEAHWSIGRPRQPGTTARADLGGVRVRGRVGGVGVALGLGLGLGL